MEKREPHIIVQGLTIAYGDFLIQRDLTFTINRGDIFIIMGEAVAARVPLCAIWSGCRNRQKERCFTEM